MGRQSGSTYRSTDWSFSSRSHPNSTDALLSNFPISIMTSLSTSDLFVIALGLLLGTIYLFKDKLFAPKVKEVPFRLGSKTNTLGSTSASDVGIDPRDFVAKLQQMVKNHLYSFVPV